VSLVAGFLPKQQKTLLFDPSDALIDALCRTHHSGDLRLVAVGGDGTVHRLLTAAARYEIPIGILPRGTANDLARAIGLKMRMEYDLDVIRADHMRSIDLITVNGKPFATCGGMGLPSSVAIRRNCRNLRNGTAWVGSRGLRKTAYFMAAFQELRRRHAMGICIEDGGMLWSGHAMAVVISNQAHFGGFFSLSPKAVHDDGVFDLCVIPDPANCVREAGIVLCAALSRGSMLPGLVRGRMRHARVCADRDAPFFGDGEILTCGRKFSIAIRPRAVRLIVPESAVDKEIEPCAPAASWC
jgi:YegS/Rv2252/BmrU family lipid kinase